MAWSNKAIRRKMVAEKSHSMGFMVRVEDKLHTNIIQPSDKCYFTVRPVEWVIGQNDQDITNGTSPAAGNGISLEGTIEGTGEARVFQFEVQAAMMNLDPEEDWWYDITYIREGYSIVAVAGEFEVVSNVTNRAAQESFTNNSAHSIVIGIDNRNLLQVTAALPMPVSTAIYTVDRTLNAAIGGDTAFSPGVLQTPGGRPAILGDLILGTNRVLGEVRLINSSGTVFTRTLFIL